MSEQPITSVEDAVAKLGALPMPVGPEPRVSDESRRERYAVALFEFVNGAYEWSECEEPGAWLEEADAAIAVADEEQVELRARVAELEAERHVTNEALSDAAVRMRADRDRIAELERVIADAPASYVLMDRAAAVADRLTGTFAPTQALREDDEFGLHHDDRVPRDLPGTDGAR